MTPQRFKLPVVAEESPNVWTVIGCSLIPEPKVHTTVAYGAHKACKSLLGKIFSGFRLFNLADMGPRRQRQRGQCLPGRGELVSHVVKNTLSSTQPPNYTEGYRIPLNCSHTVTFRVPSPTESEEEEIRRCEDENPPTYHLPTPAICVATMNASPAGHLHDRSSLLGDSSSLFSNTDVATPPAKRDTQEPHQFGKPGPFNKDTFDFHSPTSSKMVVEREPPKPTPQGSAQATFSSVQQPQFGKIGLEKNTFNFDSQSPSTVGVEQEPSKATLPRSDQVAIPSVQQPQFGKPSPLQNRLQPNNIFNIPKPYKARPEHHRPNTATENSHLQMAKDIAHHAIDTSHTHQTKQLHNDPDVVEIPRPANITTWNQYPRPAPFFSALNAQQGGFSNVNSMQIPLVDLTRPQPQDSFNPDAALLDGRFGAADPYMYVDAGKATENIKALLEGAFEDEEDKPRTRSRKKKVATGAIEELADKLHGFNVKEQEDKKNHDVNDDEEDEEEDDGTVEGLNVKLLPHQVDGVAWMRDKEVRIKKKNGILPKGGILADDMGLGKTIQSIALLLTNPRPPIPSITSVKDKSALSEAVGNNTLVVAPLALIKQWEAEIKNRVSDSHKLRVCVHHGPQRTKRFEDLKKYDVVITTYQILVSEHGSSSGREDGPQVGCFGIHWYRTILDEAHTIKNRNAKATQACYALRAEYRWCLTGTPMQNNLDELQSLIKFLKIKPYNDLSIWKDQITRPLSQGRGGVAIKRLQFYLKAFMKRRTKDVLKQEGALNPGGKKSDGQSNGFKITARRVESVISDFSPDERRFYDRLEQRTNRSLEQMMGGEKMNYASALVLLLRLRQACNHSQLVGGSMAKDRDALSTGQAAGAHTPRKSKPAENDIDAMADLLGGLSMQTKQCDVCQIDLSDSEIAAGLIRCTECEEDLRSQKLGSKKSRKQKKQDSFIKSKSEKFKPRVQKNRKVIVDSSDEEEGADWVVPEHQRQNLGLGKVGGSDDENAGGGGKSLASDDTDTEDESEIREVGSRQRKLVSLDTSDEDAKEEEEHSIECTSSGDDDEEVVSSSDSEASMASITTSAKIRQLLKILQRESSTHKFIVFSQFTTMLDLIEPFLNREGLVFTRYDGSMRNDLREASLERLRNNSKTRILLCSLKCGSLGLNLTAASRVVIVEPFWNPFVEEQAIDRVHRLNQTLDVVVYKLTVANTVEERILELQEKKRALANAAIEGKAVGKLSMKDILNLFKHDAEHDGRYDENPTLGAKTRVLTTGGVESGSGRMASNDDQRQNRITPPVTEKPRMGNENSVFGRRW